MHWLHGRLFFHLRRWVVGAFVLALLGGLLLPVYSDEVGWRLQERAALDGVDKLYSDNCGPNTLAVPPWFMMPVRAYSAFFNTHFASPFWVRVSGVLYALVFLALLLRLIKRIGRDGEQRQMLGVIGTTLLGLGVLPLLLVWSRPEQPVILMTLAALVVASRGWQAPGNRFAPFAGIAYSRAPTPPRTAWWRSLLIVGFGVVALSYHFKAMAVMPVMLGCIAFASRDRRARAARVVAMLLLAGAAVSAAGYWVGRMECPADPLIARAHGKENLLGQLAVGSSPAPVVAEKLLGNYRLHKYVDLAAPTVHPMSAWLAANRVSDTEMHGWQGGMAAIWGLALAAAALASALMARKAWTARHVPPETVLALLLFGVASAWCVSQLVRHVYEAGFVLPLVMLAIVLALASPHGSARLRQAVAVLALGTGPLMVLSVLLVAGYYGPPLVAASQARGSLPDQPYSVPLYGWQGQQAQMMALARQCRLPDPAHAQGVMIDDATYFAYMQSRLPQHQLAIIPARLNGTIDDPIAYLRARGSSGLLTRCADLPEELRRRAHSAGGYCCMTPADWGQ